MEERINPEELAAVLLKFAIAGVAFLFGCYINSLPLC